MASLIHQARRTLDDTQIKAWPSVNSYQLIPARANSVLLPHLVTILHPTFVTAYGDVSSNTNAYLTMAYGDGNYNFHTYLTGTSFNAFFAQQPAHLSIFSMPGFLTTDLGGSSLEALLAAFTTISGLDFGAVISNPVSLFSSGDTNNSVILSAPFYVLDSLTGRYLTTAETGWNEATRTFS